MTHSRAYLAVALLAIAAGACSSKSAGAEPKPERASGTGYSFPIPQGWELLQRADLKADVAIKEAYPAAGSPAMLMFEGTPPASMALDPTDLGACKQVATGIAGHSGGTVGDLKIIDGPTGKTCQFPISRPADVILYTIVKGPKTLWVVGCVHGASASSGVLAACDQALHGVKFE